MSVIFAIFQVETIHIRKYSTTVKGNKMTLRGNGRVIPVDNWNHSLQRGKNTIYYELDYIVKYGMKEYKYPVTASPYPTTSSRIVSSWLMCAYPIFEMYSKIFRDTIVPPLTAE